MFKKYYTTGMSDSAKQLQMRFIKMRSQTGRKAKIFSAVMAMAVIMMMVCGAVVIAAIDTDGLEHWDKNEVYFRDGVKFSLNIFDKKVPNWVYEDITDKNGNIDITLSRYQSRDMRGEVSNDYIISLTGTKGTIKMANCGLHSIAEIDEYHLWSENQCSEEMANQSKCAGVRFVEFNNEGFKGIEKTPKYAMTQMGEHKYRHIKLNFGFDKENNLEIASINFSIADENDNPTKEQFYSFVVREFSYIGSFLKDYAYDMFENFHDNNNYFTTFEDDYKNRSVENIKFDIAKADLDGIVIKSEVTEPQADRIRINVFSSTGALVAHNENDYSDNPLLNSQYIIRPKYTIAHEAKPIESEESGLALQQVGKRIDGEYIKGEKYRVCIVLFDKDLSVIYRWQDYITMQ